MAANDEALARGPSQLSSVLPGNGHCPACLKAGPQVKSRLGVGTLEGSPVSAQDEQRRAWRDRPGLDTGECAASNETRKPLTCQPCGSAPPRRPVNS